MDFELHAEGSIRLALDTKACRGLIVDAENWIVQRPFEKFFSIEQLEPFDVYDKLDGSLGILYWVGDEPAIATRGSFISDQAKRGTEFLRARKDLNLDRRYTYLFEIIYPENRVVVNYGDQSKRPRCITRHVPIRIFCLRRWTARITRTTSGDRLNQKQKRRSDATLIFSGAPDRYRKGRMSRRKMALKPATYAEALEKRRSKPQKPRKPMDRGRGIQTKPWAAGLKRTQKRVSTVGRKKGRKTKRPSVSALKKKAWVQFSIFIRTRGADTDGTQRCFTCGVVKFWRGFEAGHLVSGRGNAVLFDERAVRPQCRRCNGHLRGNVIVYYPKMVALYGQQVVDEIVAQRDVTHKWGAGELEGLFLRYGTLNAANPLVEKAA